MKLYTKTGDKGETGLATGERIEKTNSRIAAIGEVDELNSFVGLALTHCTSDVDRALLLEVQRTLFTIGAQLAQAAKGPKVTPEHVATLEHAIDEIGEKLPALSHFILPGGAEYAARLHVCRSMCRRAERAALQLGAGVSPEITIYLNRLSSLFFALARKANQAASVNEEIWKGD